VLATGGYQANAALRQRYQPGYLARTPYLGLDTCRGDGHLLGQAVGGDLVNMTMIPPLVMVASAFVEDAIAVNREGRRFHDEAGPYDARVEALLAQPERSGFYVFDDVVGRRRAGLIAQMPEPPRSAPTLAGLADLLGCDPGTLEETVGAWNAGLAGSPPSDPAYGRVIFPSDRRGIVTPPFSAVPMVLGINFPAGGFRVSPRMQVVDVHGRTVPGLLAVGDCVGGINPAVGLGGIHISSALALGRVAGRAAAQGGLDGEPVAQDLLAAEPLPPLDRTVLELVAVPRQDAAP
jgi:succinate dehydrogenase/fumarate reductase flavoprotein subunit